ASPTSASSPRLSCCRHPQRRFGQGAAAQAGPRTTRHKGDFLFVAEAEDCPHLRCGCRQQDSLGEDAEVGEAVALIGTELLGLADEAALADDFSKLAEGAGDHHSPPLRIRRTCLLW